MKNDLLNDPDFTAYALGEATLEQSTKVRHLLATNPEAREEFEKIQATVDALQQSPPTPNLRLHPRQRETILTMGQIKSLPPATLHPLHRPKQVATLSWKITKYAAAAAITIGAFLVGQHFAGRPLQNKLAQAQPESPTLDSEQTSTIVKVTPGETPTSPNPDAGFSHQISHTGLLPEASVPDSPDLIILPDAVAISSGITASNTGVPPDAAFSSNNPQPAIAPKLTLAKTTLGFTLTKQNSTSLFVFTPNAARRKTQEFAGVILASPTPVYTPPQKRNIHKKDLPQPALQIRSWKAEVASCPWHENRRLMRLVAQVPVDQPAIELNEEEYQIQASFDPKQVFAHRIVAEKHLPPASGRNQATRIVWYELILQPDSKPSDSTPITLGELKVLQPNASTPPNRNKSSNFDSDGDFQLIDRGTDFKNTREDFMFESAMVGFSLLLRGTENIGTLDHDLVLEIAERSSDSLPSGERAKFIQSVQQAKSAAGL